VDFETYLKELKEQEKKEQEALKKISKTLNKIAPELNLLWRFGDGEGGRIFDEIISLLRAKGYAAANRRYDQMNGIPDPFRIIKKKKTISHNLRRQVFERDAYRCKRCNAHKDLAVDHIHPESKGGTLDLSNLQTLCRSCNSKKAASIPTLDGGGN
jgi:hypothetical protein